jgi:hypothetical protein
MPPSATSGSCDKIQTQTAGFQGPFALSHFSCNVMAFDVPESNKIRGNGYSGYLYKRGENYHIENSKLIRD